MIDGGAEVTAVEEWKKASGSAMAVMSRLRQAVSSEGKERSSRDSQVEKEEKKPEASPSAASGDSREDEDPKFDFPEAKEEEKIMVRDFDVHSPRGSLTFTFPPQSAAHKLHNEASCWDSQGNALVAAAKRAAVHLATLHAAAQ